MLNLVRALLILNAKRVPNPKGCNQYTGSSCFVIKKETPPAVVSKSLSEAKKVVGPKVMSLLEKNGIKFSSSSGTLKGSGGSEHEAAYLLFQSRISITPPTLSADKQIKSRQLRHLRQNIIHEIGHAVDSSLFSKKPSSQRGFDEHGYWSKKGLKDSLKKDLKAAKKLLPGYDFENSFNSWGYAFKSGQEAFAHIFNHIHGDDVQVYWLGKAHSVKDIMPNSYKLVQSKLKSL